MQQGIRVIGVTSDDVDTLNSACPFTLLADPGSISFAKYGCAKANGLQHGTFFVNANRQVTWRTVGSSPYLAVKDLLNNIPLSESTVSAIEE